MLVRGIIVEVIEMNKQLKKLSIVAICIAFFMFFAWITYLTPLAGDDWGYAVNGLAGNPFVSAYNQYFTWSGRFFSELWGLVVAPRKWLWNILNPLLFTTILYLIYKIINPKKYPVSTMLIVVFLILSVSNAVRMETYTWIMGTTYVVPLCLFLLYIYLLQLMIFDVNDNIFVFLLSCLINIYIPLCMENIAVGLILANVLVLIYMYKTNKKRCNRFISLLVISIVGFAVLRLSPGASYRLTNEHQTWMAMNIVEQMGANWQNFLTYTFLENKTLIMLLSVVLIGFTVKNSYKYKKNTKLPYLFILIFALGFLQSLASELYALVPLSFLPYFFDLTIPMTQWIVSILYALYVFSIIWVLSTMMNDYKKWTSIFLVLVGGTCNIAMLASPIFGPRSSLYTIFLFILLTGLLYEEMMDNTNVNRVVIVVFASASLWIGNKYIDKYQLVNRVQKERLAMIQYYQEHPEEKEAWLPRMPYKSIHSADVEEGDTFHQEAFKAYYGLSPEMQVIFYWKESY